MNEGITINSDEVAKMMGTGNSYLLRDIRNYITQIKNIDNLAINSYFRESSYINSQNKKQPCYKITLKGIKYIIDNKRKHTNLTNLIQWYNNQDKNVDIMILQDRKEIIFLEKLESSLKPFNMTGERQYSVLSYRIDYYIPLLNIAIEYDEYTHENYTYEQQEFRQALIEKELGCKFIRVSDKYSDEYNIGLVIKELFQIAC